MVEVKTLVATIRCDVTSSDLGVKTILLRSLAFEDPMSAE